MKVRTYTSGINRHWFIRFIGNGQVYYFIGLYTTMRLIALTPVTKIGWIALDVMQIAQHPAAKYLPDWLNRVIADRCILQPAHFHHEPIIYYFQIASFSLRSYRIHPYDPVVVDFRQILRPPLITRLDQMTYLAELSINTLMANVEPLRSYTGLCKFFLCEVDEQNANNDPHDGV